MSLCGGLESCCISVESLYMAKSLPKLSELRTSFWESRVARTPVGGLWDPGRQPGTSVGLIIALGKITSFI